MDFPTPTLTMTRDVSTTALATVGFRKWSFGAVKPDLSLVPDVDVQTSVFRTVAPTDPQLADQSAPVEEGPALFAGFAPTHFGHSLTCALGRLWALQYAPKDLTLYFLKRRPAAPAPHIERILALFGVRNSVKFVTQPMRFREFWSASDLFGERFGGRASPVFRDWSRTALKSETPKKGAKIYVTRSGLGPDMGRYACETLLEDNLRAAGYEIFAPEAHSIDEQIAVFRSAETIIFAEGSAIHLFAFVKNSRQRAIVLGRRKNIPPMIEANLRAFEDTPPFIIDAIRAEWWRHRRASNASIAELDFELLRDRLISAGALTDASSWRNPTPEEALGSLREGMNEDETLLTPEEHVAFLQDLRRQKKERAAKAATGA